MSETSIANPAAFARPFSVDQQYGYEPSDAQEGMTLRDYFAAAALCRWTASLVMEPASTAAIAAGAYAIADALLVERAKGRR